MDQTRRKRTLRTALIILAALVAAAALAALSLPLGLWNPSYASVVARYQRPASRFIDLDGARIHYQDEGSGQPIILIHGFGESLYGWDDVAKRLPGYRIIRLDRPNHGLSQPLRADADLSLAADMRRLDALLDRLEAPPAVIGGISYGGQFAYNYAATRPARIKGLVIMSSSGMGTPQPSDYSKLPGPIASWVYRHYTPGFRIAQMIRTATARQGFLADKALIARYADFYNVEGRGDAFSRLANPRDPDTKAVLARIRVPVMLVWGDSNPAMSADVAKLYQAALVNAPAVERRVYPGVGHKIEHEAPAQLAADLDRFAGGLR